MKDSEWQWHQLGHMQVCTYLQTDNHASTLPLCFYRPGALPAAQPCQSTEGIALQPRTHRQDKTMSVNGLRCILYARIYILYIPYTRTYRRHGIHGVTVTSQSLRPRYDRHRILGSVGLVESTPQPASRSVRTFLHGSGFVQQTQRQTHAGTYTTLRR